MKQEESILVAIHCLVYNHEPYLRDCFEGFVMQKTNFRFVAIVHDDCSTDNSADIIREYEAKYPDIFRPIYETENQWHKTDGSLERIMNVAIDATGAKYVAMCEGDDYWTDPYKLQKQVDFMEAHPDYSICFSRVKCLQVNTGQLEDEMIVRDMPGESSILDLATGNYIHTVSVMFRYNKVVGQRIEQMGVLLPGDYVMWMLYAETGKIYKLPEKMAVYRLGSGVWSGVKGIGNELSMLITLTKLWAEIPAVRDELWEQIQNLKDSVIQIERKQAQQLSQVRKSRAYKLGRVILKPFKWLKK